LLTQHLSSRVNMRNLIKRYYCAITIVLITLCLAKQK